MRVFLYHEQSLPLIIGRGYDVNLVLDKKDEDHFTGSVMSRFKAKGAGLKQLLNNLITGAILILFIQHGLSPKTLK